MEPDEILTHLKRIPMFRELDEEGEQELLRLVPHIREQTYQPGEQVLTDRQAPDRMLLIISGQVKVTRADKGPRTGILDLGLHGPGTILGRQSLEIGDFESTKAEAVDETRALSLPFRDLVRTYQKSDYLREHLQAPLSSQRLIHTLRQIPLFGDLAGRTGELELYQIAQITHEQYFEHGEWLFRQGEVSDRLIYMLEGRARLTLTDQEGTTQRVGELEQGERAGETGLLVGDFHDVTAIAEGYARGVYILHSEFNELLRERPYLRRNLKVSAPVEKRRRLRRFDWIRQDEWAVSVVQRHWTRLFNQIAEPVVIFLLLLPAMILLLMSEPAILNVLSGLLAVPMLGLLGIIIYQYFNWRDDYFVLTTQRMVHIERVWPFTTHHEEVPLDKVQDIFEIQPRLAANLMGYGNLILQTAGETINIDMDFVPNPGRLRRQISEQIERARARSILQNRGQIRELLTHRIHPETAPPARTGPATAVDSASQKTPSRLLPGMLVASVWQYFFPPSKLEMDDGNTIIWQRYWLPGLMHSAPAILALLLVALGGPLYFLVVSTSEIPLGWIVTWLFAIAVLLGVSLWLIEDWRNDYFELTPSRVVLFERLPLLLKESRREANLDRIQNLGYRIPSIPARILDYGHVHFETAGTEGRFVLHYVRHPKRVQSTISNRQYQFRQLQSQLEAERRQQELLTWFSTYDELQREPGA